MFTVDYVSPFGKVFPLVAEDMRRSQIRLMEGGIQGLVGEVEARAVASPLAAGRQVHGHHSREISGSLTVQLLTGARPLVAVWAEFIGSFSVWQPGRLRVSSPLHGVREVAVRLSGAVPPPTMQPGRAAHVMVEIPLVADGGLWWQGEFHATGTATITNPGDDWVWPVIEWDGQGGTVTLPSGARFTLPAVSGVRRLHLSNAESCVVLDLENNVDHLTWDKLAAVVLPEGVPPAARRRYALPPGAKICWRVPFHTPWS